MRPEFNAIFEDLRAILRKHSDEFVVNDATAGHYRLDGRPGPATLEAWGGTLRRALIPVAWVEIGKAYVSYHLMGVYGSAALRDGMSPELQRRMQGKTCFNFTTPNTELFQELDHLTGHALTAFRETGFITDQESA